MHHTTTVIGNLLSTIDTNLVRDILSSKVAKSIGNGTAVRWWHKLLMGTDHSMVITPQYYCPFHTLIK